jgi:hypothetical protein
MYRIKKPTLCNKSYNRQIFFENKNAINRFFLDTMHIKIHNKSDKSYIVCYIVK